MVGDLTAYAILVFACPVMWGAQRIHDWWSEPNRAYFRNLWIADHMHPRLQAEAQSAWIRGAAVTTPASSLTPALGPSAGAGTQRGSAEPPSSVEPRPTPGPGSPGVGPKPRTVDEPHTPEDGPARKARSQPPTAAGPQHLATSASIPSAGGQARQPVDVDSPRVSTSTGVQPRDREGCQGHESGALGSGAGAPVRGAA